MIICLMLKMTGELVITEIILKKNSKCEELWFKFIQICPRVLFSPSNRDFWSMRPWLKTIAAAVARVCQGCLCVWGLLWRIVRVNVLGGLQHVVNPWQKTGESLFINFRECDCVCGFKGGGLGLNLSGFPHIQSGVQKELLVECF